MATQRCEICEEHPSKYYCEDCDTLLCLKDIRNHKTEFSDIPTHRVTPLHGRNEVVQGVPQTALLCEMCSEKQSKFICEDCDARMCPKDARNHKTELPDMHHFITSLRRKNEEMQALTQPSIHTEGNVELTVETTKSEEPIRNVPPERSVSEPEATPVCEAEHGSLSSVSPPTHDTVELLVRRMFVSHFDVAQNFKLNKWILKLEEAENLIQIMAKFCDQVKVVGLYGTTKESLRFIQRLTEVEREIEIDSEDSKEGIIAYARPDLRLICFYFKISQDEVYERKPYPSSSREAIYIRLLFDLCPLVVCCLSESIQANWYWSADPQLYNPFLPRTHKGMIMRVDRRKVESSAIEERKVVNPFMNEGEIHLTSDHLPFLFMSSFMKKDFSKPTLAALEKLKAWLSERKSSLLKSKSNYSYDYSASSYYYSASSYYCSGISYNPEFDTGSFHTFKNYLRAAVEDNTELVNTVKEKFINCKSKIATTSLDAYKEFLEEFQGKFKLAESCQKKGWNKWGTFVLDDFFKKMHDQFIEKRDFDDCRALIKEVKHLVLGFKDSEEDTQKEAKRAVNPFLKEKSKMLKTKRESAISQIFSALEEELFDFITKHVHSKAKEVCTFKTYTFVFCGNELIVQDKRMENKLTLQRRSKNLDFHVLDKDAAFASTQTDSSFQIVKFNPSSNLTYDIEVLQHVNSEILIASGSTVSLFVAFSNQLQRAYYGAAQEMKGIDKGISLKVYGEMVAQVISACVLQKIRRIMLLNEQGRVFFIELVRSDKRLMPVMVDCKAPRISVEGESLEPEIVRRPLVPTHGEKFYDIKSSDDETLYFMLTDTAIEIYDLNFLLAKTIPVESSAISFKVLSTATHNVVITKSGRTLKAYSFQSEIERVESSVEETKQEIIPGNPVIDILYYALFKFGSSTHFSSVKPTFYLYSDKRDRKCEEYFHSIASLTQSLQFGGTVTPQRIDLLHEELASETALIKVEELKWRLFTRSPLHLCSIQDGNMIPLQDGLNNFEDFISQINEMKTDFVTAFVSYIRLGSLEPIIRTSQNIKVIVIIGKQSSGKSYLLNRLFGTRFDVAAHRCTDGIWISVTKIQDQTFFILDCEGLFSVERTVQEEIKLCLLLAAISDVTILNQDLTFNRNLSFLFEKFTFGIDRLKGSKLFKGCLEIAIRDVAANQDEGANAEVKKFVNNIIAENKADFLIKLFGGVFMCCSYHNFENQSLFEAAVVSRRQFYLDNIPFRWESGEDFLIILKTVIAQIYADDSTSIDSRTFQLKLSKILAEIKKAIEVPSGIQQMVAPENPQVQITITIAGQTYSFSMAVFDVTVNLSKKYLVFDEFLEKHVPVRLRSFEHNEWYEALESFMKTYFGVYKQLVFGYLERSVSITEELHSIFEGEKNVLEKIFDNLLLVTHTLCRRRCKLCDLCCLRPQNHSGSCDCSTNHKCLYSCSVCADKEMCSQNAGHTGSHLCNSKPHICGRPCDLRECRGTCIAIPNHTDAHRCGAATHPCGLECALFHLCKRTCDIDQLVPHEQHNCGQKNCPFSCCLCKGECISTCMSQDHLHGFSKEPDELRDERTGDVLHFCNKEHLCNTTCDEKGLCGLETIAEKRVWCNEYNTFSYNWIAQKVIKHKCRSKVPVRALKHTGEHKCGKEKHNCTVSCPDCGTYCELPYGHEDVHSSGAHRNKEKCIYVAKTEGIEFEIEEESKRTTRKLRAGESAKPEFCDQSCVRKGRGHTHPMECKGGTACLEVAQSGRAVHSKDRYYPDLGRIYDLVECDTYWKLKGWEAPVFKKNPEAQKIFSMCPFYCGSPEHTYNAPKGVETKDKERRDAEDKEKIYCEGKLFHSNSLSYKDHIFSACSHKGMSEYDIAFILDCTGSMGRSFPQVKDAIIRIINQYKGTDLSNKFAIVGYTDHSPHHGVFPADIPVSIYPSNRQFKDFNIDQALSFISALQATGGGPKYGEAMVDGMNAANGLGWRPRSSRMCFIIADDCPHGDNFYPETEYPNGCPCKHDWKQLLNTMKSNKTEIRFVILSTIVNRTASIFKTQYGEGFESITLESMDNISLAVFNSVVSVIEHNLEFAID